MGNLTCTASGSVANFYTPYAVPIRSFKVHFSPKQSGTGDPSPTNVRPIEGWTGVTGYRDKKSVVWNQWLKPLSGDDWRAYDTNNITAVFNDGVATSTWLDKKYRFNTSIRTNVGTLQTQEDVLYVSYMVNPSLGGLDWGVEFGYDNQATCIQNAPANVWQRCSCIRRSKRTGSNHTYISYCRSVPIDDFIGMTAQTKSPILINLTQMFGAGNEPETAEEFEAQCALNGINLEDYQAYDEGTAIGWKTADTDEIPISFPAVGKNIWDEVWDFGAINTTTGAPAPNPSSPRIYSVNYIPVIPGVRYYASIASWIALYDKDKNLITDWNPEGVTRTDNVYNINRFTAPDNCYYFRFYTSAAYAEGYKNTGFVVRNDEPDKTYEPYLGNTFYSGSIDLITGELIQTHAICVMTGDETNSNWNWNGYLVPKSDSVSDNSNVHVTHCSHTYRMISGGYFYSSRDSTSQLDFVVCAASAGAQLRFRNRFVTDEYSTNEEKLAAMKTWLQEQNSLGTPVQIVYELETPITKYIAPQTLSTLVHSNAFWSNADSVEIEYDLAECGDIKEIRRRILLNTPHLETVSGSVAHFNTDMTAKLKECKVNFLPQQAGSGDPSPSNVRSISGWTGCDVVHSGKNIVDIIGYSAKNPSSKTGTRSLTNNYGTTISTTDFSLPDSSVILTQSQWDDSVYKHHHKNGYMSIVVDNLIFGQRYNVSFRVTNITNNPLNASISELALANPNGNYQISPIVDGDRVYFKNSLFRQNLSDPNRSAYNIQLCGMSFTLSEFMVTPVEDEDYTYAPYDPDKITVSWDNLGTIYGGFIDVLRGELVQEWEMISKSWGDIRTGRINETTGLESGVATFINQVKRCVTAVDYGVNTISNIIGRTKWEDIDVSPEHYYIGRNASTNKMNAQISLPSTLANDTVIQIAARLETPITYPLSPEIIKAIKGVNNVWSDAGDVEVKFWTH